MDVFVKERGYLLSTPDITYVIKPEFHKHDLT